MQAGGGAGGANRGAEGARVTSEAQPSGARVPRLFPAWNERRCVMLYKQLSSEFLLPRLQKGGRVEQFLRARAALRAGIER